MTETETNTITVPTPFKEDGIKLEQLKVLKDTFTEYKKGTLCRCALSQDGTKAIVTFGDIGFAIYSIPGCQELLSVETEAPWEISFFECDDQEKDVYYVAVGRFKKSLELYELSLGTQKGYKLLKQISSSYLIYDICPVPNGVVYSHYDGSRRCLKRLIIDGAEVTEVDASSFDGYHGCCYSPSSQEAVVGDVRNSQVYYFDVSNGGLEYEKAITGFSNNAVYPRISPEDDLFVSCAENILSKVSPSGDVERGIKCDRYNYRPIGNGLITFPEDQDSSTLIVSDWKTGYKRRELEIEGIGFIKCAEYSNQGYLVVFGSEGFCVCSAGTALMKIPPGMSYKSIETPYSGVLSAAEQGGEAFYFTSTGFAHCLVVSPYSNTVYLDGKVHSRYSRLLRTEHHEAFLGVNGPIGEDRVPQYALYELHIRRNGALITLEQSKEAIIVDEEEFKGIQASQNPSVTLASLLNERYKRLHTLERTPIDRLATFIESLRYSRSISNSMLERPKHLMAVLGDVQGLLERVRSAESRLTELSSVPETTAADLEKKKWAQKVLELETELDTVLEDTIRGIPAMPMDRKKKDVKLREGETESEWVKRVSSSLVEFPKKTESAAKTFADSVDGVSNIFRSGDNGFMGDIRCCASNMDKFCALEEELHAEISTFTGVIAHNISLEIYDILHQVHTVKDWIRNSYENAKSEAQLTLRSLNEGSGDAIDTNEEAPSFSSLDFGSSDPVTSSDDGE